MLSRDQTERKLWPNRKHLILNISNDCPIKISFRRRKIVFAIFSHLEVKRQNSSFILPSLVQNVPELQMKVKYKLYVGTNDNGGCQQLFGSRWHM